MRGLRPQNLALFVTSLPCSLRASLAEPAGAFYLHSWWVGGPSISSLGWVGPFGPQPAAAQILEIEIHGWPAVLEADLERAAAGDGFIALSGGRWACPMIPPIKPGGKPLGIEAA
jgi:hypothetical protein